MSTADWIEDDHEMKVDLRLWKKLLKYTLRYRWTTFAFTSIAFVAAVSDLGFPLLTGRLISDIETNGTDVDLAFYTWAYAGVTFSLCAAFYGFILCAGKIRTHVSHDIRSDAFRKLQQLSFSFYDTRPVGWLMARLTSDCMRLSNILAWGVIDLIWGTALMIGITVAMLIYNWKLALAVLSVMPLLLVISIFFRKRILRTRAPRAEDELEDHREFQRIHPGDQDVESVCAAGRKPARLRSACR